jgi:hypothetical protein
MLKLMASFSVSCLFLFPNFARSVMEKKDFHKPPQAVESAVKGKFTETERLKAQRITNKY